MEEDPQKPEDGAKNAGRGGLAVAAAKLYFLVLGLVQQIALTRVLGAEGYGAFSRVLAIANVANNVAISAGIQGASRAVAEAGPAEIAGAQRGVLRLHAALSIPLAALFAIVAPMVAERTGAAHIVPSVRLVSLVLLGYTVYAPLVGTLNGRRRFVAQAGLDAFFGTLRTLGMLGLGYLLARTGSGPLGATLGFSLAALFIVVVAGRVAGVGKDGPGAPTAGSYFQSLAPLALAQLFLNTLMQVDITLLGNYATEAAGREATGQAVTDIADRAVAVYRACQLFSFLPYQLLFAVTFILFPMLAKAHAEGDRDAVAVYVRTGTRLAMLIAGAIVAVVFGLAPGLLHVVFKPEIADGGGPVLRVLALGQGAFALYGIATTVLTSLHRERTVTVLNGIGTLVLVGVSYLLVPGVGVAEAPARMAWALGATMIVALVVAIVLVIREAKAFVSPVAAARILFAFGLAGFVGTRLPSGGKILTIAEAPVVAVVYLVVLLATRELGENDLSLVKRVLGRK